MMGEIKVFSGRNTKHLAHRVCAEAGVELGKARTILFPDGEVIVKLDDDVRGRDCYVIISTCDPVNDNLMELLVFCDCLRRASAKRVTLVMPYYGYGRQDRKDEGRVPITAKLVANLITAARADRVLAIDLHAAQIQGFFDLPVDHLSASPVFFEYFKSIRDQMGDLCLVSPDVGNVKVAEKMANLLDADLAIINKRRLTGDTVEVGNLIGSVKDKTVLMFDDMISTGGTVCEAAKLVMEEGAADVIAAATHGVLAGGLTLTHLQAAAALFGRVPTRLEGRSVYDLDGDVEVNGRPASIETPITPGDLVETGGSGRIAFVVGTDAYTLRPGTRLQLSGASGVVRALRLFTGALLSVFGRTPHRVSTTTATIGIRGTAVYAESEPSRSYVCTCYGVTKISSSADPSSWEVIRSIGHDMPRYIEADAPAGEAILGAPLKNHTDIELKSLEALVGREVPFGFSFDRYRPRARDY